MKKIELRAIQPGDRDALRAGFERLSEESRYWRFLAPQGNLSDAALTYLTNVDHHDHEAMVAIDPVSGQGIGVARYVRLAEDPEAAEMAIVVADQFQSQGVGTQLTLALAGRAREEGIARFTALILADNASARGLLDELGRVRQVKEGRGTLQVTVELRTDEATRWTKLLRSFAGGDLRAVLRQLLPAAAGANGSDGAAGADD